MNLKNAGKISLAALLIAAAPSAKAESLSASDFESIRGVLRALNVSEGAFSNEEIQVLRDSGLSDEYLESSRAQLLASPNSQSVELTCGTGTHGGGR